ncbi:TonB-dependent vitamin B12 receptor [Thermochromatium tepidum]|uniref:TonB-dependent vitamin B12 receptor n=1 Tax=Thermochromatium tepidum ATCC 43061 TaxID=316276 RepID=A0A6I6E191_THETI|nr:TonB-dependent vitamin B12 receptor [Thermochromatium tepidum]QGU33634.1 TonB-dependent vitamin B12 receptor [Thermochromatium tepidum ATCC 43061]
MSHPWMLAALGVPLAGLALADGPPVQLEPMVVTATRTNEPETESLAAVTVIDRAEIERRQARSLPDLLRGLPGLSLARTGGPGQQSSLFVRGTNSDHVLVLVDGIRIGSATTGRAALEDLPLEQIERIEIVRGPRSSLYGSEAIGGVIQIFTRRGGGDWSPRLILGGGTLGTARTAAGLSGGGERGWFDLGVSFDRTDGINACAGRATPFAGCGVEQDDRDPYRNLGLSLSAGYRLSDRAELDLRALRTEGRLEFDGSAFAGNIARPEQQVLSAKAVLAPLDPWTLTLTVGQSQDEYRAFFDDPDGDDGERFVARFATTRDSLSLQNDWRLMLGQLATLGLDYRVDHVEGSIHYDRDTRDNLGVFGEYQARLGAADLKLSLRRDDDGELGGHNSGDVALGYLFETGTRVALNYGTAFKAPSFNDLYYPDYGNPDLDPERARSWELRLTDALPLAPAIDGRWDLSLYHTAIDDLIAYDAASASVANVRRARICGLEATTSATWRDWRIETSLTLLDPENRSPGANQGNLLPRRPEQSLALDLERDLGRWSLGGRVFVAGRRYDDLANRNRLDGYVLLDLRAEYRLDPKLRLQVSLENALDTEYETAYLYNQLGRSVYLTFHYQP